MMTAAAPATRLKVLLKWCLPNRLPGKQMKQLEDWQVYDAH